MSWKDSYLIHKLKASPLTFHFSLHVRSLFSEHFNQIHIHVEYSFLLPSSRLRHAERACELSPSQLSLSLRKRRQRPNRQRKAGQRLTLSLSLRRLLCFGLSCFGWFCGGGCCGTQRKYSNGSAQPRKREWLIAKFTSNALLRCKLLL